MKTAQCIVFLGLMTIGAVSAQETKRALLRRMLLIRMQDDSFVGNRVNLLP
jgi:hypothetical protein